MKILKQTENFVAIFKDVGELSVPSRDRNDPRPVAGLMLQSQLGRQIYPIHRIDLNVSGLLLFALSARAQAQASKAFEAHQVQKTYIGFSESLGESRLGETYVWTSKIVRGKRRSFEADHGLDARTTATAQAAISMGSREVFEWILKPQTGRPHQLRFEMAKHKVPLMGDVLYGSMVRLSNDAIALCAVSLEFEDPDLVAELGPLIEAPTPTHLEFLSL